MRYSILPLVLFAVACSQPEPVGKRVYLAKGNISFVLPDSSLIYGKPTLWPGDYKLSDYGEAGSFYHNQDSSTIASVYIKAYPDLVQQAAPWRMIADEKRQREELLTKNRGLITIERFTADSSSRTVTVDYRVPKRPGKGRRWQASYEKTLSFYGPHRTIKFWFFAPGLRRTQPTAVGGS
ncbi:MAG: hypothetical protein EON54_14615 [Alcaligenaceae bacterium]|nr:MAG: hypothetical protein EON54_14615 [Alcaligenaceae bacterium]